MKKIEIFVGSDSAFEKIVPKSARNLSEMAAKLDDGNKKMDVFVNIPGQPEPKLKKKKKPRVQDFVIVLSKALISSAEALASTFP